MERALGLKLWLERQWDLGIESKVKRRRVPMGSGRGVTEDGEGKIQAGDGEG